MLHLTIAALLFSLGQTPAPAKPKAAATLSPASNAEMGLWLVNLARHQGHLVGRTDPRSASLHVLAILEAAISVDPDCAEAYFWLYDLQHRLGQVDQAMASLTKYVQLVPTDDAARIRLFDMGLDDQQTAEKRVEFVQNCLKAGNMSAAYESELRLWLARFYFEKGESENAGKEIEDALRLNPMNIQARELAYEMYGETEAELQRVEMGLQLISINPTQANLVWDLGELLDRLSLHKQAQEWFNRAIALHKSADSSKVPADFWQTLAMSYVSSGDWAKAKEAADSALEANPNLLVARLLRSNALSKLGKIDEANADVERVGKAYEVRIDEVTRKKLNDEAAEIAWFFCYYKPDKDRALKLAEVADGNANSNSLAKLAHAYALRANGKTDEAVKMLEDLATRDQMAALELAKIRIERSKKAEALTLLQKAAAIQYSGIAFNQIREMLVKYGEKAPEPPLRTKIVTALEKFHRDVFDFPKRPGDFLKFSIRHAGDSVPTTGPINLTFRMENASPFPITFGEGFMVRPLVAVSAKVSGNDTAVFRDFLQVLMNSRAMLIPGDAVEKTVAVDVGPFREHLIRTAGVTQSIEFTAMLDPVYKNNDLTKGPGTIVAAPLTVQREGLDGSPGAMGDLTTIAAAPEVASRIEAGQKIGALLAFAEKGKSSQLPFNELRGILARLLADKDWRVRAHAVTAAGWSTMDGTITAAAAPAVRDENAVVKLLAVRLFAPQHGDKFRAVLEQLSKNDPTRFVRLIAASYLPESQRTQASSAGSSAGP